MREATPNELSAALPIMSGALSTSPLKISPTSEPPFDGPVTRSTPFAFTIASFLADRRRRPVRPCSFSAGQLFRPRTWLLNYAPENKLARLKCGRGDFFAGSNGETDMVNSQSRFVWYELMTTDIETAKAFYANVVGWGTRDAGLAYNLFTVGDAPVTGLMNLPEDARRTGATPHWIGYVGVDDVDAAVDPIKQLGGAVYVPPTDVPDVSRFSVVADPQMATLTLVKWLHPGQEKPAALRSPGHVGWHELSAVNWEKAFAFYGEIFGWQKVDANFAGIVTYQLFSAAGQ